MRLGDEPHDVAALLQHQRDGLAFIRADAMRGLHTVPEPPRGSVTSRSPFAVHSYSKNAGARTARPRPLRAAATKRCAGAVRTGVSRGYAAASTLTAARSTAPNAAPAVAGTPARPVTSRARSRWKRLRLSTSSVTRTTGLSAN